MSIRVLAIGDIANNFAVLRKFVQKSEIRLIAFPRDGAGIMTYADNMEFFDSFKTSKHVKKINEIKEEFDICLTTWAGARVAYLADLKYIMYFVGNDIRTPPFIKNPMETYLQQPLPSFNFLERLFYRNILENAIACVACGEELFTHLKKYRKDAIRIDRNPVDTSIFNEYVKPLDLKKTKFTFFSPQRIGLAKGHDIIWNALSLCKSDFEVIQVEWFDERTAEEQKIKKHLLETKPPQVKLIPLIKREDMPKYYVVADAILGQMGPVGTNGGIEREAVFCKRSVLHYADPKIKYIIDGKEMAAPFLPNSREPEKLAELIDKVVESKEFREKLLEEEYEFVKELADPYKAGTELDELFEDLFKKHKSIKRNSSVIKIKFRLMYFLIINRLYLKKIKNKIRT
ncbi:MAG: hypothetical protein ACREAE_00245 [Nitrosopumilaceae archaeon]